MRWKSKNGLKALDLDKIAYWKYTPVDEFMARNKEASEKMGKDPSAFVMSYKEESELQVYFGGDSPILFHGAEADDIYNILRSQKEVL